MGYLLEAGINLDRFLYCTTRDIRRNEKNGRDYIFKTNEEYEQDLANNKVVESRCYHMAERDVYYYTLKDIDLSKDYIVAGTINQCLSYIEYFGRDVVIPVRIFVNEYDRLIRGIERERRNKQNYREVCRRFYAEFDEYTDENFSKINFALEIENYDLDDCCEKLKEFIENYD